MRIELGDQVAILNCKRLLDGQHEISIALPMLKFNVPYDPQIVPAQQTAECLPDAITVFVAAFKRLLGREVLQLNLGLPLLGSDGEPVSAPKPSET